MTFMAKNSLLNICAKTKKAGGEPHGNFGIIACGPGRRKERRLNPARSPRLNPAGGRGCGPGIARVAIERWLRDFLKAGRLERKHPGRSPAGYSSDSRALPR